MTSQCRICAASLFDPLWKVRGFEWVKCKHCGSLQTTIVPTPEELDQFYGTDYYGGESGSTYEGAYIDYIGDRSFIQRNLKCRVDWVVEQILPLDSGKRHWLDVGCAAGFLLDITRHYGFVPWGLDYSDFGPHYARTELGMSGVRKGSIDQIPDDFPDKFDVISAIDVIEHLTDQRATLTKCLEKLVPGGLMVGETFDPASIAAQVMGQSWHAIDPPNHLAILSLSSIDKLMQANGLTKVSAQRLPRWLSLGSIATKFGRSGRKLAQWSVMRRIQDLGFPINVFDVVIWMYRKDLTS